MNPRCDSPPLPSTLVLFSIWCFKKIIEPVALLGYAFFWNPNKIVCVSFKMFHLCVNFALFKTAMSSGLSKSRLYAEGTERCFIKVSFMNI